MILKWMLKGMSRCELDWSVVGYLLVVEIQVLIKEVEFLGSGPPVSIWKAPHFCGFCFINTGTSP
jgi:hypothetical protein